VLSHVTLADIIGLANYLTEVEFSDLHRPTRVLPSSHEVIRKFYSKALQHHLT